MFVLVVTHQATTGELVRQTLGAEGWWVTAVADRETAVRSASDQAPQLVVIDGSVDEAGELVRFFASSHGGPGALLLGDGAGAAATADAVLPYEPDAEELAATARRLLKQPPSSPADRLPAPGAVLNAQDIFGDLLAEMEGGSDSADSREIEAAAAVETRSMVIPEPTTDAVAEDPDPAWPSFDRAVPVEAVDVADARDAAAGQPEPVADPVPPREHAASPAPETVPAAVPPQYRLRLPGGPRFWLGMAAGVLAFVAASFLLDRFFSPPPAERPAAVVVPAADAVDLEELVDEEMARREAELRESLLEEERRLQRPPDELTAGDG